jgi:hypothetical protein
MNNKSNAAAAATYITLTGFHLGAIGSWSMVPTITGMPPFWHFKSQHRIKDINQQLPVILFIYKNLIFNQQSFIFLLYSYCIPFEVLSGFPIARRKNFKRTPKELQRKTVANMKGTCYRNRQNDGLPSSPTGPPGGSFSKNLRNL